MWEFFSDMHNLPDPLLFSCLDKVGSLSSVQSYVVSAPQTVLWTPPTSVSATCNFGIPYMHALLLSTNTDLPSCTIHLPLHTIPATPRDMMIRFRSLKSSSTTFPLCPQGQHLHFKLTRLHLGSLALRSAVLPRGNLQPLITQTLLPGAKEVYEQLLLRDFNLIRFIADNGIRTRNLIPKKDKHHVPKILVSTPHWMTLPIISGRVWHCTSILLDSFYYWRNISMLIVNITPI